jgi:hypothetical protein
MTNGFRVGLGLVLLGAGVFTPGAAMAQGGEVAQTTMERSGVPSNLGDPIGSFPLPSPVADSSGLADAGSNLLWHTANSPTNIVYLMNTNGNVVKSFSVAANTGSASAITSDGTFLYIVDFSSQELDIYDMDGVYQSSFAVPFTPTGITYNPNTGNLYISYLAGGILHERTTAGVLVNSYPVVFSPSSQRVEYDAQRDGFWIIDTIAGKAELYNLDFTVVRQSISLGAFSLGTLIRGVAVKGNKLYVVHPTTSTALIFDITEFQLAVPFYLDNGTNLSGTMPTSGVAAFVAIKNMSAKSITLTIVYTSDTGLDYTPANNTVVLGPNQSLSWRPDADDPAEGAGQAVPNKTGGFPAGSVLITADGPITGRLAELDGDSSLSRAYALPKP